MQRLLLFALALLAFDTYGQKVDTIDLKSYFGSFTGGFCLYDINTSRYIQYNTAHCKQRFSPCSTFKIPNSLIGLETGVITDTGFVINYDSILHPKDSFLLANDPFKYWYGNLSLQGAFRHSCVWYYQELARRVGYDSARKMVQSLDYGNGDISSGLDTYWLCGSLQVSVNEQIDFLKRLYLHELAGFSDENMDAVKHIMRNETTPEYTLYGKTGGGDCWDDKVIGWYVGYLETASGTKIFAMNILVDNFDDLKHNFRVELVKNILRGLALLPVAKPGGLPSQ